MISNNSTGCVMSKYVKGIGWSPVLVGKIFDGVVSDLSVANCCSVLLTAWKIKTSESIAMNEVRMCQCGIPVLCNSAILGDDE